MAEFRQNYVTKEWGIIAPERALRPGTQTGDTHSVPISTLTHDGNCPFCAGNESLTGAEVLRYEEEAGVWRVRVVRNKYSPLHPDHSTVRRSAGLFLAADSYGYAEVVVETPDHNAVFHGLSRGNCIDILNAYRERALDIGSQPNISVSQSVDGLW